MGCVSVKIGSQCGCLKATIGRVGTGLSVAVSIIDEPLKATIGRVGANINAKIGLICTPNTDVYVRVSPNTLWFFKENEILDVDVMSNVKWIVK